MALGWGLFDVKLAPSAGIADGDRIDVGQQLIVEEAGLAADLEGQMHRMALFLLVLQELTHRLDRRGQSGESVLLAFLHDTGDGLLVVDIEPDELIHACLQSLSICLSRVFCDPAGPHSNETQEAALS